VEEEILRAISGAPTTEPIELTLSRGLGNAFQHCDREFLCMHMPSGATCASVMTWFQPGHDDQPGQRKIFTAHLGDTRAVLCRQGIAIRLTSMTDHKANHPECAEEVRAAGGFISDDRVQGSLSVARAFGDSFAKAPVQVDNIVSAVPYISVLDLYEGVDPFVVIACDGIWDVLDDQEVIQLVMGGCHRLTTLLPEIAGSRPSQINMVLSKMVVQEALDRGSTDNCSCMIVML
jgi:serine/threonine protein phosphatase PrpC